jgi:hypothetical protein
MIAFTVDEAVFSNNHRQRRTIIDLAFLKANLVMECQSFQDGPPSYIMIKM